MKETNENRKVTGEFNDSQNDNEVYEESASQNKNISYYGDWMVKHESGSRYDEGHYGWSNGEFLDEAPSWESFSTFEIYYCGEEWVTVSASSLDDIYLEFKKIEEQPDKSFYFAYDTVRQAVSVSWVNEPSSSGVSTANGTSSEVSKLSSCNSFLEEFATYLDEFMGEEEKFSFKEKDGDLWLFRGDTKTMYTISFSVDGESLDPGDQRMSLPPDGVHFANPDNWYTENDAKYFGALLAFADSSVGDYNDGSAIVARLHDSKDTSENLSSGNYISGTFHDLYSSIYISFK